MKNSPYLSLGSPRSAIDEAGGVPKGYRVVWADEFDVDGLPDPKRWDYDTYRNSLGWFNHELQYFARARPENSRIAGGSLIITARKEDLPSAGLPGPSQRSARERPSMLVEYTECQW